MYLHNTDVPLIPLPRYYCFGHYPPLFYPLQIRFLENLEQEKRVKILETGQPKRLCFRISISSLLGLGGLSEMQYNRMVNGFLYSTFHGCIIFFVLIRSTNGCLKFYCISILAQYATKVSLFLSFTFVVITFITFVCIICIFITFLCIICIFLIFLI